MPLEDLLGVVQDRGRRVEREGPVRRDSGSCQPSAGVHSTVTMWSVK